MIMTMSETMVWQPLGRRQHTQPRHSLVFSPSGSFALRESHPCPLLLLCLFLGTLSSSVLPCLPPTLQAVSGA